MSELPSDVARTVEQIRSIEQLMARADELQNELDEVNASLAPIHAELALAREVAIRAATKRTNGLLSALQRRLFGFQADMRSTDLQRKAQKEAAELERRATPHSERAAVLREQLRQIEAGPRHIEALTLRLDPHLQAMGGVAGDELTTIADELAVIAATRSNVVDVVTRIDERREDLSEIVAVESTDHDPADFAPALHRIRLAVDRSTPYGIDRRDEQDQQQWVVTGLYNVIAAAEDVVADTDRRLGVEPERARVRRPGDGDVSSDWIAETVRAAKALIPTLEDQHTKVRVFVDSLAEEIVYLERRRRTVLDDWVSGAPASAAPERSVDED